jgi:hypothetical protein
MGANTKRDMNVKLGGVLEPGTHRGCECIEIWDSGETKDYVFRSPDNQEFKQRVYRDKFKYILGAKYKLVIKEGFGDVSIQTGSDGKYQLVNKSNKILHSSNKVGDLYGYVKAHDLKIIYNSIVKADIEF